MPSRPRTGVISIQRDGVIVTLPVNPENVPLRRSRDYQEVDILNYRTVGRFGLHKLAELNIDSFFPEHYDSAYCNYPGIGRPQQYIDQLRIWQQVDPPKPVWVHITGIKVDTWFALLDFDTEDRAGEPGDIYYHLGLKEYVFSASSVFGFGTPPRPPSPNPDGPTAGTMYEIVAGDTLWAIAKRAYGNGAAWPYIWEANKPMTSGNPDLIYPGEVVFIPASTV